MGLGGGANKRRPQLGWVPQEASTFIDACSGPAGFLVSLLVGKEGPGKAVEMADVPPHPQTQCHGQWYRMLVPPLFKHTERSLST